MAIMPMKVNIKGSFKTFFKIIISGRESPITAIINARAVPRGTPFSMKTLTIGIIPAALE